MMNNTTLKTNDSHSEMFGVDNIETWYQSRNNRCGRTYSAQEIIMSMTSDIQHSLDEAVFGDTGHIRVALNRIKWITMNKLSNR